MPYPISSPQFLSNFFDKTYSVILESRPAIDTAEAFLLAVFLRRYITYCARRGRYAAMNGAARLYAQIGAAARIEADEHCLLSANTRS